VFTAALAMKRTFVTFNAALPDQAEWTEQGSPLVPGGKGIAVALSESLRGTGLCLSEVTQCSFYGWAFEITFPKTKIWCLLQAGETWLLLLEERKGVFGLFQFEGSSQLDSTLRAVDQALKQDHRFSSIRWYTKREYEAGRQGGSNSPV
jgi:hypothetical protein